MFYIPKLAITFSEQDIIHIFQSNCIGEVIRVDFVPRGPEDKHMHSAFVHCSSANPYVLQCLENFQYFSLRISRFVYWILLKNKHPVPDTKMNIHQMAENLRILEKKVADQQIIIEKLEESVEKLKTHL